MKQIRFLLIFLLFSTQSFAAIYYVSISGNDSTGDGSSARPWRTLRHATTIVAANQGHTIKLLAGTFVENAYVNVPTGVNIEGSGIGVTILQPGSAIYHQTGGWHFDKHFIKLIGGGAGNQSIKNLTLDGASRRMYGGILVQDRSNVLIQNIRVQYFFYTGVWLHKANGSRITQSQFKDNAYGDSGGASGSIYLMDNERIELDHLTIDEAYGQAVDIVTGKMHYLKMHDNHLSVSPVGNWVGPGGNKAPNIAVEIWNTDLKESEIYNNYLDNSLSIVQDYYQFPRTGFKTVHIYNNVFDIVTRANGGGYGIELMVHDAEVNNNYFLGGQTGVVNWEAVGRPARKNWKIHHNVFYGLSNNYPSSAINLYANGIDGAHIYNNTVETIGGSTISFIEVNNNGVANNVRAENNLIIDSNTSYAWFPNRFINLTNGGRMQNSIARNNFLQKMQIGSVAGVTYSNNKSGDPQIQKTSPRPFPYYSLQSGSPLIDAGVSTGATFAGSAPDIGAHEVGLSTSPGSGNPQVSISSPSNNSIFTTGQAIAITAEASDSDGTITKVEFFHGTTKLGEDATSPYTFSWTNASAGTYDLTAKATDNSGATQTSSPVTIQVKGVLEIPGKFEAEDYTSMSGVQTQPTTDTGGGINVGWIEAGDWMDFSVKVAAAGTYTVHYRVASETAGGGIALRSGATTLATTEFPNTGGWQQWTTVNAEVSLPAGTQTLRLVASKGAFNVNWLEFKNTSSNPPPVVSISGPDNESIYEAPAEIILTANATDDGTVAEVAFYNGETLLGKDASAPFSFTWTNVVEGTYTVTAKATDDKGATTTSSPVTVQVKAKAVAIAIPGTVQAEDYVAMSGINTETTTDTGGGKNVGWFETGDWLDFNVNVAKAGKYSVKYRVSSQNAGGVLEIKTGSSILATTQVASTSGWQTWKTIETTADLNAGLQTLRLGVTNGAVNVNWISFETIADIPVATIAIPGIIQTEAFAEQNGIQFAPSNDEDGTPGAGWIDAGDWMSYNVDVKQAGTFKIEYRVASSTGGGSIDLYTGNTKLLTTAIPSTGGWEKWSTIEEAVTLDKGIQTLKLVAPIGGFNINWMNFSQSSVASIPGVIQAESFSKMSGIKTESTTDVGGGENVGWMESGDWLEYVVNATQEGTYKVGFRVATTNIQGATLQLRSGSELLATTPVPLTGDWQKWTTVFSSVSLTKGTHTLRLDITKGSANLNWMEFTAEESNSAIEIPGLIQAESYTSMEGIKTEEAFDTGGGKNIGWIETGDWVNYSVNVTAPGKYKIRYRIASSSTGGTIELRSGDKTLGTTSLPSTGGWQKWQTVETTATLTDGIQTLQIVAIKGGFNLNWIEFEIEGAILAASTMQLPRIFSPNGDGINDYWAWDALDQYESCKVTISNQLGQVVYQSDAYQNNWDGTVNGTPLMDAAYYYVVICGGEEIRGSITIVR